MGEGNSAGPAFAVFFAGHSIRQGAHFFMNRTVIPFFGTALLLFVACQIHSPNLQPNVELLDTERSQKDEFVNLQTPLVDPADRETQEVCPREVSADQTSNDPTAHDADTAKKCTDSRKKNPRATPPTTTRPNNWRRP
jgi:hypothetical protein